MLDALSQRLKIIFGLVLLLSGVHLVNILFDNRLIEYGIAPRQLSSLPFVCTAPFIHVGWTHLFNNLLALSVFAALSLVSSIKRFVLSSLFIILVGGLMVWLFARPAIHVGASGWIFGLWSLTIANAWFDKRFINILIALLVLLFYGGMAYGLLPQDSKISFESHLFGAFAGLLVAFIGAKLARVKQRYDGSESVRE